MLSTLPHKSKFLSLSSNITATTSNADGSPIKRNGGGKGTLSMVRAIQAVVPPFQLSSALDMATISWSHRWKDRRIARLMASWSSVAPSSPPPSTQPLFKTELHGGHILY